MATKLRIHCPNCNAEVLVPTTACHKEIPETRAKGLTPVGDILVYHITSDQIREFIREMATSIMNKPVKVTLLAKYCEKKHQQKNEPHRSYASLRIAISDAAKETKDNDSWCGKLIDSDINNNIHESLLTKLIHRYQYDPKDVSAWMKNYKILDRLEDTLGMNEAFIEDIYRYKNPMLVKESTDSNNEWVLFAAAPEKIIVDMLSDAKTHKPHGKIQIQDTYSIAKDTVEFVVHVCPEQLDLKENIHVRQILMGENKNKK